MMARQEETLPLTGGQKNTWHHNQQTALGATSACLLILAILCLPQLVPLWHPLYYSTMEIDHRGWTCAGVNALWLALGLAWTLFHVDNGPCVATACLLCSLFWLYVDVVLIAQWAKGQLPLFAIADLLLFTVLLVFCARVGWDGVASPSHTTRSDGSDTWRRIFRKWVLVLASLQLLCAFVACWPIGLPLAPPVSERESAPWEWNSAFVFVMTLAVLWAAFLTRGGLVDETKQAACAWCVLVFAGGFVLCSFSWPALGMVGHGLTLGVVLALDVCVFLAAAVV